MIVPFQCPNCKNWYTPVPVIDEITGEVQVCIRCQEGSHAANKAGIVDCHVGHQWATKSEVALAKAYASVLAVSAAGSAGNRELAVTLMDAANSALAAIPEALRWAGVMEMPGMVGEEAQKRFKAINVIDEWVRDSRRPPQDLRELRRSERVCTDLANACVNEMTAVRAALAAMPMTVSTPLAPPPLAVAPVQVAPATAQEKAQEKAQPTEAQRAAARERMAKVRAAKAAKKQLVGSAA